MTKHNVLYTLRDGSLPGLSLLDTIGIGLYHDILIIVRNSKLIFFQKMYTDRWFSKNPSPVILLEENTVVSIGNVETVEQYKNSCQQQLRDFINRPVTIQEALKLSSSDLFAQALQQQSLTSKQLDKYSAFKIFLKF